MKSFSKRRRVFGSKKNLLSALNMPLFTPIYFVRFPAPIFGTVRKDPPRAERTKTMPLKHTCFFLAVKYFLRHHFLAVTRFAPAHPEDAEGKMRAYELTSVKSGMSGSFFRRARASGCWMNEGGGRPIPPAAVRPAWLAHRQTGCCKCPLMVTTSGVTAWVLAEESSSTGNTWPQ